MVYLVNFSHTIIVYFALPRTAVGVGREVRHNTLSYVAGLTQIVNGFVSCHNVIDMVARQPRSRITICDIDKLLAGKDIKNRTFPNDQKCQM